MQSDLNTMPDIGGRRCGPSPGHIAITSLKRHGRMRLPVDYVRAIEAAGGRPRVFSTFRPPPGEPLPAGMDLRIAVDPEDRSPLDGAVGLLLPGGGDVDPDLYGRDRHPKTHNVNRRRDRFELTLLDEAIERDLPVLAVCRGMQLLNVYLGGTLDQHLADDSGRLDHYRDRPRAEAAHDVKIKEASLLEEVFGAPSIGVNSHHHQGLDDVAAPLEEIGWAEDGVLEAVESREHSWILGVQWHPEVMTPVDDKQRKIFESFVARTREHGSRMPVEAGARSA